MLSDKTYPSFGNTSKSESNPLQGVKLVILDFDGTIARLQVDWLSLCRELSAICSRTYLSIGKCLQEIESSKRKAVLDVIRGYELSRVDDVQPNERLVNFIKSNRSVRFAILSNNMKQTIEEVLKRLSVRAFFEVVVAGDEVRRPKPDTEGMEKILASFPNIKRANVLYVGDHNADIEIGKRCGIQTMLISEFNKTLEGALN
jgi:HAD superfamily hydrolase (TIGR01549 family)